MTSAVKEDTEHIKKTNDLIPKLMQEIAMLRLQVSNLENRPENNDNFILSRFLDEAESYAESVAEIAESQAGVADGPNDPMDLEKHDDQGDNDSQRGEDGTDSGEESLGVPQTAHDAYSLAPSSNEIPKETPDLLVGIHMGYNYTSK
jgi:hypothetical protein